MSQARFPVESDLIPCAAGAPPGERWPRNLHCGRRPSSPT